MINVLKNTKVLTTLLTIASITTTASVAQGITLRVEVENIGPEGGVYITPVWVGFHDGSFDSYDDGLSSQLGLERIAEDGDVSFISTDFLADQTYIDIDPVTGERTSATVDAVTMFPGSRVDGALGTGPIKSGSRAISLFQVAKDGSNDFFSYASMILPSNDYYLANGNPEALNIRDLLDGQTSSIEFFIGQVGSGSSNDAGTEVNDFATSAGNALFGIPGGQTGPNQGVNQGGVNANLINPYAIQPGVDDPNGPFANTPVGFADNFPNLDFNNTALYPNGIARITITAVPESSTTLGLMLMSGCFLLGKVWQNQHKNSR
ncbi:MAG: spondin domain-containing protein [Crocosphaera sp.]|nr:spondin domain-containing protein [Crocosphaera sp.]